MSAVGPTAIGADEGARSAIGLGVTSAVPGSADGVTAIDIGLSVGAGPSPIGADEGARSAIGSGVTSAVPGSADGVTAIDIGLSVGAGPSSIGVAGSATGKAVGRNEGISLS